MPLVDLTTEIYSAIDICFDLSRRIDLHKISTAKTNEVAIGGKTEGLIGLNEFVTWEASHFGVRQKLTTKVTSYSRPYHFRDEQVRGIFKVIKHDHYFSALENRIIMTDKFFFESPGGVFGRVFNRAILTRYLRNLLLERNQVIKAFAESEKWKAILQ